MNINRRTAAAAAVAAARRRPSELSQFLNKKASIINYSFYRSEQQQRPNSS
jgi:hypothetical protein